jgi:hypothetical protein
MDTKAKFVIKRVGSPIGGPEYYAIGEEQERHYWVSKPTDASHFTMYPDAEREIENAIETEGVYNIEKLFFKE